MANPVPSPTMCECAHDLDDHELHDIRIDIRPTLADVLLQRSGATGKRLLWIFACKGKYGPEVAGDPRMLQGCSCNNFRPQHLKGVPHDPRERA